MIATTAKRQYPTMPERIEALATTRRTLAQADGSYLVESSTPGQYYKVADGRCTCPDATRRERTCKHAHLVNLLLANLAPPTPAVAERRATAIYARSAGRERLGLTAPVGAARAYSELFPGEGN